MRIAYKKVMIHLHWKWFFLSLFFVAGLSFTAMSTNTNKPSFTRCIDTDHGKKKFQPGAVEIHLKGKGRVASYADHCTASGAQLVELYCENGIRGEEWINCKCGEGKCAPPPPPKPTPKPKPKSPVKK